MASSTRFFSRKRLARSRCLLTSPAIRLNCPCRLAVVEFAPAGAKRGARSFSTIRRGRMAGKTCVQTPCGKRQVARAAASGLANAVLRVPGALLFPYVDDLADMVGVVRADVRKNLSVLLQFRFVPALHPFLKLFHDLIKLLHGFIPSLGVKLLERFIVVAAEFLGLLAFQDLQVP